MADREKSGLDHATQVASFAKGALKAGKAIAGASKGAALGPYGLAAGLAWENRKVIGKAVIAFIALLMLPIMMLMMLPTALFGVESDDVILDDPIVEDVLFEDMEVIAEQFADVCTDVDRILDEAYQAVLDEINEDFDRYSSVDTMSVSESEFSYDTTRIICEFSAMSDFDETINRKKLKKLLSEHSGDFFTFIKTETELTMIQTVVLPNGDRTSREIPYTEVNYTVEYVGDDYITSEIFKLTDEQKELAADLADSLSLFINGGDTDAKTNRGA